VYLCGPFVFLVQFGLLLLCIWRSAKQKTHRYSLQKNWSYGSWYEIFKFGYTFFFPNISHFFIIFFSSCPLELSVFKYNYLWDIAEDGSSYIFLLV
jgi:4-hydroxybenzoate polyprenyltransferase